MASSVESNLQQPQAHRASLLTHLLTNSQRKPWYGKKLRSATYQSQVQQTKIISFRKNNPPTTFSFSLIFKNLTLAKQ